MEGKAFEAGHILGCCCSAFVVAMFTHDKRYSYKEGVTLAGWTGKRELRHATSNAGSHAAPAGGETPMLTSATNRLFRMQYGLFFLRCSTFESRSALEGHRRVKQKIAYKFHLGYCT